MRTDKRRCQSVAQLSGLRAICRNVSQGLITSPPIRPLIVYKDGLERLMHVAAELGVGGVFKVAPIYSDNSILGVFRCCFSPPSISLISLPSLHSSYSTHFCQQQWKTTMKWIPPNWPRLDHLAPFEPGAVQLADVVISRCSNWPKLPSIQRI